MSQCWCAPSANSLVCRSIDLYVLAFGTGPTAALLAPTALTGSIRPSFTVPQTRMSLMDDGAQVIGLPERIVKLASLP